MLSQIGSFCRNSGAAVRISWLVVVAMLAFTAAASAQGPNRWVAPPQGNPPRPRTNSAPPQQRPQQPAQPQRQGVTRANYTGEQAPVRQVQYAEAAVDPYLSSDPYMPGPDGVVHSDDYCPDDIQFDGSGCMGDCCQSKGIWGSFDYLLWWTKGQRTPPLVTTSDPADAGVLGEPTTSIVYGNDSISAGNRSGGRLEIGKWMDCCNELGIGGRFFGLGDDSTRFARNSTGDPLLARPFFNADLDAEDSLVIASPGIATGSVDVETTSQIYGAEAFIRKMVYRDCRKRTDMIVGYQFTRINEGLTINSVLTSTDPNGQVPVGTVIAVKDQFTTENAFQGAELGFTSQYNHCRWNAQFLGKLGVGMMRQTVNVKGQTAVTVPNDPTDNRPFGLLAQPSNIGSRSQDEFVVVPELGVNLTYCLTNHMQLMVGYTFMYWSSVVQPGNQIDRVISPADDNGQQQSDTPQPKFHESDYWAQGVNFGVQWTW